MTTVYINFIVNSNVILKISSVFSIEPFEGGEKNLILSLQQKSEPVGNVFLEKLFSVFDLWYTGKKDSGQELDKVNFTSCYIDLIIYMTYNI